jgi:hypothetical protein
MPSYLQLLPEDIITLVYKLLYKSILNDMKNEGKYKNMLCFTRLLDISKNPYIDTLDYRDLVIHACINDIVDKYGNNGTADSYHLNNILYYKSYYIKPLETNINKIEIFNHYIYNLYKDCEADEADEAGDTCDSRIASFNNKYFASSFKGIKMRINKNGFVLEKDASAEHFSCLAELLYYTIDLYDFVKQNLYMNIQLIEQIGTILTLSQAKRKEQDDLLNILNYHCNHRYLEDILYDTEYNCAKPQLE